MKRRRMMIRKMMTRPKTVVFKTFLKFYDEEDEDENEDGII
jgi:hypothetical protein